MTLPLSKIGSNVKESFLSIGDDIEIFPLFGRKKNLKLNRTKITITIKKQADTKFLPCEWLLPSVEETNNKYLVQHTEDGYFYIRTLEGEAFKLNGIFVNEAYLCRGDELIIGHNKISFPVKRDQDDIDLNLLNDDLNILIEGETGVGKSRLAKKYHEKSQRKGDFIQINLSSLPVSLIESEIFGHVKGAFTGAIRDKVGAIEQAQYGTLFLDEIDSLPLDIQVKLLLFLDNKTIRPVGGIFEKKCETAIIFASGKSLKSLVNQGLFRMDLFYRISSGHKIQLKPLRDDRSKILKICEWFEFENNVRITLPLKKYLSQQPWPGNIRQLIGHLEKKKALANGRVLELNQVEDELYDFNVDIADSGVVIPFRELKRRYFERAYFLSGEDVYLTAKRMSVSHNTVKNILSDLIHPNQ